MEPISLSGLASEVEGLIAIHTPMTPRPVHVQSNHKARVRDHFDRWARDYDHGQLTTWLRAFQSRLIDVMSPQPDAHILDVGCGSGWAVREVGKRIRDGRACGIDLSPRMIASARANVADVPNVEFVTGDAENIPYEDGVFDAVMCTSSFHHYPQPVKALSEFRRVLKPGARVYLLDTCRDGALLVGLYDLGHRLLVGDHVRYYHTRELKAFFRAAAFDEIREEFRVQKLFLYRKLLTSVTLLSAMKTE
jgi:ubiquinone/menaquinone biosynthesis C-methylase UbiE